MESNKDKKITASEVAGSLRKAARLYEVFKHAHEAADLLAQAESTERKLKSSVLVLQKEHDSLDAECDDIVSKTKKKKVKLKEVEDKLSKAEHEFSDAKRVLIAKAEAKARAIVEKAERDLKDTMLEIVAANRTKKVLVEDIAYANKTLVEVVDHIEKVKAKALKALG